jgi:hypothetical protein
MCAFCKYCLCVMHAYVYTVSEYQLFMYVYISDRQLYACSEVCVTSSEKACTAIFSPANGGSIAPNYAIFKTFVQ